MRRRRAAWVSLVAAVALSTSAAGRAAPPDAATRKAARILAEEGLALFDRGNHAAALERFNKADALVSAPTVDLFAARCLVKLGRLTEASRRYDEVTGATVEEGDPAAFRDAVSEAKQELDALLRRVPSIRISVEGGAGAVTVLLDGSEIPPERLRDKQLVDPGKHKVEGRSEGGTAAREVSLREGESVEVTLQLPEPKPPPKPKPPPPAVISTEDPGAAQRTLGWLGLGIGAAGMAVWGITGGLALGEGGSLSDQQCSEGRCPHGVDTGTYQGLRTVSTVGFWSGLAGLGVGTALLLTAPSAGAAPRTAFVMPCLGPAGFGVKGAF